MDIQTQREQNFCRLLQLCGFEDEVASKFRFIETDRTRSDVYSWINMEELSDLNGFDDVLAAFKGGGAFFCAELPHVELTADDIKDFISLLAFMEINEEFSFCDFRRNYALQSRWNQMMIPRPSNELIRWMERINCPLRRQYGNITLQPCPPRLICLLNQPLGIHDHRTLVSNIGRLLCFSDERLITLDQKNIIIKATMNLMRSGSPMQLHDPYFLPMMEFNKLLSDLEFRARDIDAANEVTGPHPLYYNLIKQDVIIGLLKSKNLSENKKIILIKVLSYMRNVDYVNLNSDKVEMFPVDQFWRECETDDSVIGVEDIMF